jgi:transcriptional regulator with XRE-family HTH domain
MHKGEPVMCPVRNHTEEIDRALWLQDMVMRGLAWLRKTRGMTQSALAEKAAWKQPYVSRLEDASSPILPALERLDRYASACGYSVVITFVDRETGKIAQTIPLSEHAEAAADRLTNPAAPPSTDPYRFEPAYHQWEDAASSGKR